MSKVKLNLKEIEMLKDLQFQELLEEYSKYKGKINAYSTEGLKIIWVYLKPYYSSRLGMFRVVEAISEMDFEETNLNNLKNIHSLESNAFRNTEKFIADLKARYIVLEGESKGMFSICSRKLYIVSKLPRDGIIRTSRDNKGAK